VNSAAPCKEHAVCANRHGYGVVRHNGKNELLHRVVYCQHAGASIDAIKGKVVRHSCDNSRCIEPSHLLLGTQAENVKDMLERGRQRYAPFVRYAGATNPNAKLTAEKAQAIRAEREQGAKQQDLARKYGVSRSLISLVVNRKNWDGLVCEINAAIAPLSITADGLAQLGFAHVATEKAAKLYRTADLPRIYAAMVAHIEAAQAKQAA